jgi:hypothetical protein
MSDERRNAAIEDLLRAHLLFRPGEHVVEYAHTNGDITRVQVDGVDLELPPLISFDIFKTPAQMLAHADVLFCEFTEQPDIRDALDEAFGDTDPRLPEPGDV